MANSITPLDKSAVSAGIVPPTSRYANSALLYYGPDNIITFETYKRPPRPRKLNQQDRFMVITPGVAYRPDTVSNEVYGTPDFWWKIMEYNGMKDIMDFRAGINIVLPTDVLF